MNIHAMTRFEKSGKNEHYNYLSNPFTMGLFMIRFSRKVPTFFAFLAFFTFFAGLSGAQPTKGSDKESPDERVIRLLGGLLQEFPMRVKNLKPEIRRIALYEFRVDRNTVNSELKRVLQSMIESEIAKAPQLQIATVPQLKPIRIVVTEDNFKLSRGLMSLDEMREAEERYRVDAVMDADLYMTNNNLYLTVAITELRTGSVVWKENFFTKEAEPIVRGFNASSDVSVGAMIIPTARTALSGTLSVGANATYYAVELRFTEPAWPSRAVDFVLKGGAVILASGSSFVGGGYARTGLRCGIIRKDVTEAEALLERSNWLSLEMNFGILFPTGDPSAMTVGLQAELDITRRFSFGAGVSYFSPFAATITTGTTVQVGGLAIELLALKYYF